MSGIEQEKVVLHTTDGDKLYRPSEIEKEYAKLLQEAFSVTLGEAHLTPLVFHKVRTSALAQNGPSLAIFQHNSWGDLSQPDVEELVFGILRTTEIGADNTQALLERKDSYSNEQTNFPGGTLEGLPFNHYGRLVIARDYPVRLFGQLVTGRDRPNRLHFILQRPSEYYQLQHIANLSNPDASNPIPVPTESTLLADTTAYHPRVSKNPVLQFVEIARLLLEDTQLPIPAIIHTSTPE